jgi:hypothetical protein
MEEWKKLIIFITRLCNKPQGCGASTASAAGPFTTKKNFSSSIRHSSVFRNAVTLIGKLRMSKTSTTEFHIM